jgi:hypothetical protein
MGTLRSPEAPCGSALIPAVQATDDARDDDDEHEPPHRL